MTRETILNIACAVAMVFATAVNVGAAIKLTKAEIAVSSLFCIEGK